MPTTEMEAGDMVTDGCITTDYFKVPVSAMVRHLLGRWLKIWGFALAAPPVILTAMSVGLHDIRWALVALMLVMVLIPSVILIIFYSYALKPATARAIIPHRLIICRDRYVKIEYRPDPDRRVPPDEMIPWSRVQYLRDCGSYWMLIY